MFYRTRNIILAERILADDISNFIRLVKQNNTTFGVTCQLCLDVTDDTKIIPCTTAFSTLHSLFILFTHSTRCTKYSSQSVGNADKSRNNTCPAFVSFKWIINEVLYVIFHPLWPQQSPAGTPAQIRHTWYR